MATCLSWIVEVVWFFRSAASTVGFCLTCLTKFLRVEHGRSLQCSHLLTSIARLRSKYACFCCSFELATLRLMWKGLNLDTSENDGHTQFRFNLPLAHIASQLVNGASHGLLACAALTRRTAWHSTLDVKLKKNPRIHCTGNAQHHYHHHQHHQQHRHNLLSMQAQTSDISWVSS